MRHALTQKFLQKFSVTKANVIWEFAASICVAAFRGKHRNESAEFQKTRAHKNDRKGLNKSAKLMLVQNK